MRLAWEGRPRHRLALRLHVPQRVRRGEHVTDLARQRARQRAFGDTNAVDLLEPDYAILAEALGVEYLRFGAAAVDSSVAGRGVPAWVHERLGRE